MLKEKMLKEKMLKGEMLKRKRLKNKLKRFKFLILNKIIIHLLLWVLYPYSKEDTPEEKELTKKVIHNYFNVMCDEIEYIIY